MRWKALAETYKCTSLQRFGIESAPFWNRIPKNEENHGGKRSWSNPGKTGQEKLMSSRNSLPSARDLNKGRVTSLRIWLGYDDNTRVPFG